ncbi:MAG: VanZ family protein [Rubrivivax sp.]|nr:VanZ family protein [Rubrivivax sp.]
MAARASTANALALAYAVLVVYASLYPFEGWRWPAGAAAADLLWLPWVPWGDEVDLWINLAGYVPFGLLLAIGSLRSGSSRLVAVGVAVLAPALLSYAMEVVQGALPMRHPSLKDWTMNTAGATLGVLLSLALHRAGLVDRWHALRQRWFERGSEGAMALLALWPVALLFPTPAPLGLGQLGGGDLARAMAETLAGWLDGLPGAEAWIDLLRPAAAAGLAAGPAVAAPRLAPLAEMVIVALGLLAPCVVAFAIVAPGWRRLALAFGALVLAAVSMTLSTLLNFGPRHAMAWVTPWAGPAIGAATLVVLVLAPLSRAVVLGLGLIVLTGLVVAVAQAPADPYFAHNLRAWEHGRFARFHGLAQWVGWLWPYAAIGWMLSRLATKP